MSCYGVHHWWSWSSCSWHWSWWSSWWSSWVRMPGDSWLGALRSWILGLPSWILRLRSWIWCLRSWILCCPWYKSSYFVSFVVMFWPLCDRFHEYRVILCWSLHLFPCACHEIVIYAPLIIWALKPCCHVVIMCCIGRYNYSGSMIFRWYLVFRTMDFVYLVVDFILMVSKMVHFVSCSVALVKYHDLVC